MLRTLTSLVCVLAMLWGLAALDRGLVSSTGEHSETHLLDSQLARALGKPRAKVVVLGQSTMGQWLTPDYLSRAMNRRLRGSHLSAGEVLDGHLAGCHQDCSWAQAELMLSRGRHFQEAFYGLNLYQMCEADDWKRALQHVRLLPPREIPALFGLYAQGSQPLASVGRFLGGSLSAAYRDPESVQQYWYAKVFGRERSASAWYELPAALQAEQRRPEGAADAARDTKSSSKKTSAQRDKKKPWTPSCDFQPHKVAQKRAYTQALLEALRELAEHSYFLLLPDRTLSFDSEEDRRRWNEHEKLVASLVEDKPWVTLIDLVTDGADDAKHYRDGVHLTRQGLAVQRRLFESRLQEFSR